MWLLLGPRFPVPAEGMARDAGASVAASRGSAGTSSPAAHNGRGAFSIRAVRDGERVAVRVFLHPGRAHVCEVDVSRVREQFEIPPQKVAESLGAAELAVEGRRGFLLEFCGPFVDTRGERYEHGFLFARGLRAS